MTTEINQGNRDTEFSLYYSYNIETVTYNVNNRISKFLIVVQLLLSTAIISDLTRQLKIDASIYIGLVLAFISILSLIYSYSEKAATAKNQATLYSTLISDFEENDLKGVKMKMSFISGNDSSVTGAAPVIAYKRAAIQLGRPDEIRLTLWQRLVACLAGEYFSSN